MRFGRRAYIFLCWAYLVLLPLQFALAGMGVMGGDIDVHMAFGGMVLHIIIPALMLIVALAGRAWSLAGWAFGLFAILTLQVALVGIGREVDATWVSGLHPLFAFLTWPLVYFVLLRRAQAKLGETAQVVVAEPAPAAGPA